MRIYLAILTVFLFISTICGQKQVLMSDVKFEGLKGKVKTVTYHSVIYKEDGKPSQDNNKVHIVTSFDKDGNKTEYVGYVNDIATNKTSYWKSNGFRFSKNTKLISLPISDEPIIKVKTPPKAITPDGEKSLLHDSSFDFKVKYDFDTNGYIKATSIYGNDGKLLNKKTYEYDVNGNKLKEIVFTDKANYFNDSTVFVYDSKENVSLNTIYWRWFRTGVKSKSFS
jgi:hypothetical protein